MKNIKRLAILVALVLALGCLGLTHAEIVPPYGMGQIGFSAAILCDELSLREAPSLSAKVIQTLRHGDFIIVVEQEDGWARCVLSDAEDATSGWVNADYIVVDPAWYRTEAKTPVYAWNDASAPRVALLGVNTELFDPNTFLPILKTDGEWILVSLRGAVGWIHTNDAD